MRHPSTPTASARACALGVLAYTLALGCTEQNRNPPLGGDIFGMMPSPAQGTPPSGGMAAPPPEGGSVAPTDTSTPPPSEPTAGTGSSAGAGGSTEPPSEPTPTEPEAGTGGAGGSDETSAGEAAPEFVDHGVGDGSDVVTIGDSWMSYLVSGGGIEGAFRRAGKRYRGYAVAGTTLLSGQIPGQYSSAKRANPEIATVIMTGGGNDIMFSGGCSTPEACERSLQALSDGLNELWTTMSNDGVRDVVYIRYSQGAGTTNPDNLPTTPPSPPQICITGPIRCTSIDTTDMVMGQLLDGIHPTSAANDRIAAGVLQVLEMKGIRR